ncbi:hypothetical protein lerEdw1_019988 [Lerista edwardsae]|nr:hypothetical protein lerEdw1_019988 [Lerista edwardsae]
MGLRTDVGNPEVPARQAVLRGDVRGRIEGLLAGSRGSGGGGASSSPQWPYVRPESKLDAKSNGPWVILVLPDDLHNQPVNVSFVKRPGDRRSHPAQQQRNLDSIMPQPSKTGSRRPKKEALASSDPEVKNASPVSEQDSGILDGEDEEEEEEASVCKRKWLLGSTWQMSAFQSSASPEAPCGSVHQVPGAQDLVDFSPVYRCLHIYSVLGAQETFEHYYRKQRRKQARLVLQPSSNMHETLGGYRKYFHQIVGFFVIEDHILHTTRSLVDRAYIDELWDLALSKAIAALRTHSSYCSDPNLVLDLKNLIVLFADTLQGYGFPVNQLFDLLLEIQDQYSETLLKAWARAFRNILDSDNYSPIPVASEELYRKMVGQFPFHDAELEQQPFPKKFPFSEFVPRVYSQIKEFIYACLKFSEDLHLSSTEVDDMIRKSTNLLLTRTLSNSLQTVIKRRNVGLTEASAVPARTWRGGSRVWRSSASPLARLGLLVQIIINTTHLEKSCRFLEEFITNITNVLPETVHTTKLFGTTTFKDARHAAEEEIYTNLNQKIDQFLQLADYDWMATEPGWKASDYLVDLIAFLRSTFAVFTHLPVSIPPNGGGWSVLAGKEDSRLEEGSTCGMWLHLARGGEFVAGVDKLMEIALTDLHQHGGICGLTAFGDGRLQWVWCTCRASLTPSCASPPPVCRHPDGPSDDAPFSFQGKVAQTACMSACKHLSTSLTQLLLEAEVRQLSLGALQQFSLDVEACEQFARSGPVPGFQGDTLQLAFIDLRQVRLCALVFCAAFKMCD